MRPARLLINTAGSKETSYSSQRRMVPRESVPVPSLLSPPNRSWKDLHPICTCGCCGSHGGWGGCVARAGGEAAGPEATRLSPVPRQPWLISSQKPQDCLAPVNN